IKDFHGDCSARLGICPSVVVHGIAQCSLNELEFSLPRKGGSNMRPAHLRAVEETFHAALDCEPDKLSAFLDQTCAGDEVLRGKVEALLASHQRAGSFIQDPVTALATRIVENRQADLLIGEMLGHYEILKRI